MAYGSVREACHQKDINIMSETAVRKRLITKQQNMKIPLRTYSYCPVVAHQ